MSRQRLDTNAVQRKTSADKTQRRKLSAIRGTWVPGRTFGHVVASVDGRPVPVVKVRGIQYANAKGKNVKTSQPFACACCLVWPWASSRQHTDTTSGILRRLKWRALTHEIRTTLQAYNSPGDYKVFQFMNHNCLRSRHQRSPSYTINTKRLLSKAVPTYPSRSYLRRTYASRFLFIYRVSVTDAAVAAAVAEVANWLESCALKSLISFTHFFDQFLPLSSLMYVRI